MEAADLRDPRTNAIDLGGSLALFAMISVVTFAWCAVVVGAARAFGRARARLWRDGPA
jgi:Na+-driven multidrug efflux pump